MITAQAHNYARLWSEAEFKSASGRNYDGAKDFVAVCNGDAKANTLNFYCAGHWGGDGIYVYFDKALSGSVRVNYLVVLNP